MKNNERFDESEDRQVRDALEPVREIRQPAGLRERNRAAIAAALAEERSLGRGSFWSGRLSVPLPLAAAFLLLLTALAAMQVYQLSGRGAEAQPAPVAAEPPRNPEKALVAFAEEIVPYQQILYLPGQGVIFREAGLKAPAHSTRSEQGER
jgi:hypothetical protein